MEVNRSTVRLPALAENVPEVRRIAAEVAAELGLPDDVAESVKLAVTEAVSNVVRHAYVDGSGKFEVGFRPLPGGLEVVVRDAGRGPVGSNASGAGFGIPIMRSLTHQMTISGAPGHGTEVRLAFVSPAAREETS